MKWEVGDAVKAGNGASQESFSSWQPGDLKDATTTTTIAAAFTVHDDADAEIISW